ncbi:hypothetical protein [Bradyrhizobium sp. NC92]|uniref:hypothetical protein n=1 Tax=Bradyrhizobium sp. (strain NC92) TaxID=55395 RepID=UPI0021AA0554|nr:hypothetical protein [Bradyrhizobium sp. NC92]UWU67914.1 hypothetical protein N2602_32730 [Bradyrhizobium sp. NC92]
MQKGSQSFVFCSSWPGNFELDLTRHFDEVLWSASVLQESVFQSFSAVDKKAAKRAACFVSNPVAGPISADKTIAPIRVVSHECELSSEQSVMVIQVLDFHSSDCDPAVLRLAIGKRMSICRATHIANSKPACDSKVSAIGRQSALALPGRQIFLKLEESLKRQRSSPISSDCTGWSLCE